MGLDAVALVYGVLVVSLVVFGGVSVDHGSVHLSARSLPKLLLVLGGVLAARHASWRQPSLFARIRVWGSALYRSRSLRAVFPIFVATRGGVLAVAFLAVISVGFVEGGDPFRVSDNELTNLSARWDAGWYLGIARDGYAVTSPEQQQNIAFFPAYPMLTRAAGALLGAGAVGAEIVERSRTVELSVNPQNRRILTGGVIVSLLSFLAALLYLHRFGAELFDPGTASASVVLLATYPFALFFSAPYTESLFLLGTIGAFYHLRRGDYVIAGLWGLLGGLTKVNGCLLSIPLAVMAVPRFRRLGAAASPVPAPMAIRVPWIDLKALAAASAPGVGMVLFSTFLYALTGRPLAWLDVHRLAWGRSFAGLGGWFAQRYEFIATNSFYAYIADQPYELAYALTVALVLLMAWPVARRLGPAYGVFMVIVVVPPLLAGGFVSMGRFSSVLFPMFLYVAAMLPRRWLMPVAIVSGQLQALAAVLFYTWRPLY